MKTKSASPQDSRKIPVYYGFFNSLIFYQERRVLSLKCNDWRREALPYQLRASSPAFEILDVTLPKNWGWAKSREECA
jgi:hypothetical protein